MNVGKVREVETIKGYKINRKAIGCKFHFLIAYEGRITMTR